MLVHIATVLCWIVWVAIVFGAVMLPNYVRIGQKSVRNPFVRGVMAAVAVPGIGFVFTATGWFLTLAIRSLF